MRDIAIISPRHKIKEGIEAILDCNLDTDWSRAPSAADIFGTCGQTTALIVLDVIKLFASDFRCVPPLVEPCANVLVVGLDEDVDALIAAWNGAVPAQPIKSVTTTTLIRMMARPRLDERFYDSIGRLSARQVHGFLTRRLQEQGLTDQERSVLALIRLGHRNACIATALHIREKTVKNHINSIYSKLDVSGRFELMA